MQNIKADAGIYKLSSHSSLNYFFHIAVLDNISALNRFRLQERYLVQQHGIQYRSNALQLKLYLNNENSVTQHSLHGREYRPQL